MPTVEEKEIERCNRDLKAGEFLALLGWADWEIERRMLSPVEYDTITEAVLE